MPWQRESRSRPSSAGESALELPPCFWSFQQLHEGESRNGSSALCCNLLHMG